MANGFNKIILMGNIVNDPELKQTQTGKFVTSFKLAVSRKFANNETDFFDIVAWNKTAEFISRYFQKGNPILVCGSLQQRKYTAKDGATRYAIEVIVDEVSFVGNKADNAVVSENIVPDYQEITDENLPF